MSASPVAASSVVGGAAGARAGRVLEDHDVKAILGAFPVAFVVYELGHHRIVEANDAAIRLFSMPEMTGIDVRRLMLDLAADDPGDGFPPAPMATGRFHATDGRPMRRGDGGVVHVDCLVGDAEVHGAHLRMLAMRDVSVRVEHELARDRAAHDLMHHQLVFRREVAERLHDGPVQVLTAAALRLGLLRLTASPDLTDEIAEIELLVSQSLRAVRGEMEDLRPPFEAGADLAGALEDLLLRIGVEHRYAVRCPVEPPDSVGQLFFKVVQHLVLDDLDGDADGELEVIRIDVGPRDAVLRLRTPGDGGLTTRLSSWAMTLHGTIARTSDQHGTDVVVTVPLPPDA